MSIVTRTDALSLADLEAHDPTATEQRGDERRFLCPLPACAGVRQDKSHRAFALNVETGAWHCHRCQAAGKLTDYWEERPKQGRNARGRAQLRQAFAVPGVSGPVRQAATAGTAADTSSAWRDEIAGMVPLEGTAAASYLESRGIPLSLAAAGGARFHPRYYGRPAVLFPIRNQARKLCAANGRYLDGRSDPKTRSAGSIGSGVFATKGAWSSPFVAVVEAPIDALSLAACGVPAVATIGTSFPDWLPRGLAFRRVLLAQDADPAGEEAAAKLEARLPPLGARGERLRPEGAKDWNEWLQRDADGMREWLRGRLGPDSPSQPAQSSPDPTPDRDAAPAPDAPEQVCALLDSRGWAAIRSAALGEVVLWVRDLSIPAPAQWAGAVVYTLAELEGLRGVDRETLRAVHQAKRAQAEADELTGDVLAAAVIDELGGELLDPEMDALLQGAIDEAGKALLKHPDRPATGPAWEAVEAAMGAAYAAGSIGRLEVACAEYVYLARGVEPARLPRCQGAPLVAPPADDPARREALLVAARAAGFPRVSLGPALSVSGERDWSVFVLAGRPPELAAAEAGLPDRHGNPRH